MVNASYSCTDPDGPADVAKCSGPVASGSPIDTSTVGSHGFTVNAADKAGNSSSQTVTYTVSPAGGGGGGGTPTPRVTTSGRPSAKARGSSIVVDPGINVSCPAGGSSCTADETATAKVTASAARAKTKKIVIGRAHFTIAAGKRKDLIFKLDRQGARALRKLGRLRITITVVSRDGDNPPVTTTKTITIKASVREHRH